MTAEKGRLVPGEGGRPPALLLQDGVSLRGSFDSPVELGGDRAQTGVLEFSHLRTEIGGEVDPMFRPRGNHERELTLLELWQRRFTPPPDVETSDMLAEFHGRLVRILSILALPFLAIPLALSYRRRYSLASIAFGIVILIAYNEILDFGENLVESRELVAFVGLWLPMIVFCAGSLIAFLRSAYHVPRGATLTLPGRLGAALSGPLARKSAD